MTRALKNNQLLLWTGQLMYPDVPLYNMVFTFSIREELDVPLFKEAFNLFTQKCDVFRATIRLVDGKPALVYADTARSALDIVDITSSPYATYEAWLEDAVQKTTPLEERLYDTALVRAEDGHYRWYLNMHHTITDGWSITLIHQYVTAIYAHLQAGKSPDEIDIPSTRTAKQLESTNQQHWQDKLATLPSQEYYYQHSNPTAKTNAIRRSFDLSSDKMDQLKALLTQSQYRSWTIDQSMYTFYLTVLAVVMRRLTGGSDITIGSPTHGRDTALDKQSVDVYMNLLPLAVQIDDQETYHTLYKKCQTEVNSFLRYAPKTQPTPELAKSYHTILNYINTVIETENSPQVTTKWEHTGHSDAGHHLTVQAYDFNGTGNTRISFDMNTAVFDEVHQSLLTRQFFDVMDTFLADPSLPIMRSSNTDQLQIANINSTDKDYGTQTIIDYFYQQVDTRPDHPALWYQGQSMSFQTLDVESNQLANYLVSTGIKPGDKVAICIDRSFEMLIGIYGILKSGAAYVPIDPTFPKARQQYVLNHSAAKVCILGSQNDNWNDDACSLIYLFGPDVSHKSSATTRPAHRPIGTDLMYVIYTSGSTGTPKGVMNQYDGVTNRLQWAQDQYQLDPTKDVALQKTNFCFDVSVWELFWPLMVGVPLVIAKPGGEKEGDYLKNLIQERKISIVHFVPSMLEIFLLTPHLSVLSSLNKILCSGESLPLELAKVCLSTLPGTSLHNLYGPTEAAIDVTASEISTDTRRITIGSPVANTKIQIQDKTGEQLGIGVPGEITIYGIQVARGYHNDSARNLKQFGTVGSEENPMRYYRTGDIGYWLEDSTIAYHGRMDNQIKLRGYRIELGEIENAITAIDGIHNAIVLLHDVNDVKKISAFVKCQKDIDETNIRRELQAKLPSYMIPSLIQILDEIPLTHTGKVDRQMLKGLISYVSSDEVRAPDDEFEEIVHDIWCDLFGLKSISTDDTFFALGGDSLMAIRSMIKINEAFQLELPMSTIFRSPTIREIASIAKETIIRLMAEMD